MAPPERHVLRLPASTPVWIVSDLHLGDGTPSDAFYGKDRQLLALIDRVDAEGATLVVNGDGVDLAQAWSLVRVLRAHRALFKGFSRLGAQGRLIWVIGNHDWEIQALRDVLSLRTCHELHLGRKVRILHGYEYDPYIQDMLEHGQWHTILHHGLERILGTWLRIPLHEFYTFPNRLMFWLAHKLAMGARAWGAVCERLQWPTVAPEILANLDFWCWSNLGDSMGIFRPAWQEARTGAFHIIAAGHSHLPGVVREGGRAYANSGSWTFGASQYLRWDGQDIRCHDWISGREYGDELYRPMIDGSLYERDFFQWWRESYMGFLRFREGEERRGRLAGWRAYVRDHEHVAALRPAVSPPRPARRWQPRTWRLLRRDAAGATQVPTSTDPAPDTTPADPALTPVAALRGAGGPDASPAEVATVVPSGPRPAKVGA